MSARKSDDECDPEKKDAVESSSSNVDVVVAETPKIDGLPLSLGERFQRIKKIVKNAIETHQTFMIHGKCRIVRECLLSRGWCEKFYRKSSNGGEEAIGGGNRADPVRLLAGIGELKDLQSERILISRMLTDHCVDFLWNSGSEWIAPNSSASSSQHRLPLSKETIFNRYCRAGFTSKIGLCSNVNQMHWYYEADVANTLFPRCYNICQGEDQMRAFVEDFRFTACLNLLKWFVEGMKNEENEALTRSPTGTIPLKALDFAISRCTDYIAARSHEDIDQQVHQPERIWSHQWDQFLSWYYKILHEKAVFLVNGLVALDKYYLASRHLLGKMANYWPQLEMDGLLNIWILKPGNKSRGRGIVLVNKLEDVVSLINKSDTRYVVQKYMERPMLIHGTKFDIRQWFIVTSAQPLTLWMYRESYLRFSSQLFRLDDFHESIHLCNNAVQCKYKNGPNRDPALPPDNMWDATTFKRFLREQGHGGAWDESIYPGMKQALVGSLLASQDAMDRRKNSFELYGADFMLMDDFSVWLIEINSHPDMSPSTSVTTRLCKLVMEDTIKVVIDHRRDKNAETGAFELAYKQRMPMCQPYLGAALAIQGTRIKSEKRPSETRIVAKLQAPVCQKRKSKTATTSRVGPVIVDLLEELEMKLDEEFASYGQTPRLSRSKPPISPKIPSPLPIAKTARNHRPDPTKYSETLKKEQEVIDSAIRQAVTKYKKFGSAAGEIPSIPRQIGKSGRPKNRLAVGKLARRKKNKEDTNEIYAVGQAIAK